MLEDPRDRALFATIYHYGLRVSEATLLQLEHVDFEQKRIFISRLKRGIGGERPLFANTAQLLKSYLDVRLPKGSALFTGRQGNLKCARIQQLFRRYADKAGLNGQFSVKSLRHSIATHLLEAGQGIEYVQDHLRLVRTKGVPCWSVKVARGLARPTPHRYSAFERPCTAHVGCASRIRGLGVPQGPKAGAQRPAWAHGCHRPRLVNGTVRRWRLQAAEAGEYMSNSRCGWARAGLIGGARAGRPTPLR